MSSSASYTPLNVSEEACNEQDCQPTSNRGYTASQRRLVTWACIGTVISSILSIGVFYFDHLESPVSRAASSRAPLRRPSTYINLNSVAISGDRPPLSPIYNSPDVILQFRTSDPSRSLFEDPRWYPSDVGAIYPDDRHFLVSSETSTVVQFRNLDYEMERCHLNPTIPSPNITSFEAAVNVDFSSEIDIWMLDSSSELSRHISWSTAPPRRSHFATVDFSGKDHKPIEFRCPSSSFTTFEFSCSDRTPNCYINFWQKKERVLNGVFMVQHDSTGWP
ncbi:hypothetical protein BDZ89DRAFT_1061021 [Hymenopellis radicata]|nr:hypothetical protein BDZ89DRAFT_1061021 [Hymenopellis radicata]